MAREESQRMCANCPHPKRGHELPRTEGGHGGGSSGRCITFGCNCNRFEPTDEYKEQEYVGDPMPKWVGEGVKVKVKRTDITRHHGLSGTHGNDTVWPGEVGTIGRQDGIGWWDWRVHFDRGRTVALNADRLESLIKVRR